ncbi:MAG TPA: hypothetical protein VNL77_14320 [Roseiflexaceae bacterium]|nr:hypothetical protein [Roseiflexaceae bacterium]
MPNTTITGAHLLLAALFASALHGGVSLAPPPVALLLAPALPEAPRAPQARGVFFVRSAVVSVAGPTLVLASTPDGLGELCTDDEARVIVRRGGQETVRWAHRFSSPDRRSIACLPPQTIDLPGAPGRFEIRIELEDRYPPTFSTRPYYVIGAQLTPQPTAISTAAPAGTPPPPAGMPAGAPPARTPPPTPSPRMATPVSSHLARTPPARTIAGATARGAVAPSAGAAGQPWAPWLAGAIALLTLALLLMRGSARRPAPRSGPGGIIFLYDRDTREARTIVLPREGAALAIQRQPLAAVPTPGGGACLVGRIEIDAAGPRLYGDERDPGGGTVMRHEGVYTLDAGAVTLRYRAPAAASPRAARRRR